MMPQPSDSQELHQRVRQQLILAQVRIMELEDDKDALDPQIDELQKLFESAQNLADAKIQLAGTLTQSLLANAEQLEISQKKITRLQEEADTQVNQRNQLEDKLHETFHSLDTTSTNKAQLELQIKSLRSSRSWRWTRWLRRIGF